MEKSAAKATRRFKAKIDHTCIKAQADHLQENIRLPEERERESNHGSNLFITQIGKSCWSDRLEDCFFGTLKTCQEEEVGLHFLWKE
tara:strand:- start:585 stop:845 length:261 start_codon:yes stop_codon:yes gene_type:complete